MIKKFFVFAAGVGLFFSLVAAAQPEFKAVLTSEDDEMIANEEDVEPNGPDFGLGCSWYCGGKVDKITASSSLPAQKGSSYDAVNAHDFRSRTVWVEGKEGSGVGEYLEFTFDMSQVKTTPLGVNGIYVLNGYAKTPALWKANGRVKSFKMIVDGKPYGLVTLIDSAVTQFVEFPVIMFKGGKITVIRFEIADVYKGDRYEDTAISELNFTGVGVH